MSGHLTAKVAAVCAIAVGAVGVGVASSHVGAHHASSLARSSARAAAVGANTILGAGPFSPDTLDPDPKGIVDEQTNFMLAGQYTGTLDAVVPPSKSFSKPLDFTNLRPALAKSWTPLANGLGYKFTLRSGVKSNLGNPLTAQDVAWTFKRMLNTKAIGLILMQLANISTTKPITVTGPLTFTLNLAKPSPIALDVLQISAMGILDEAGVKKNTEADDPWGYTWLASHVAGFGPYMVSSYTSANAVTLVPNPNYYGTKPSVTEIVFKQIPNAASRLQLLLGGEINLDWQADPTENKTLSSTSSVTVHYDHAALFSRILPNFRKGAGPLTNPLVRRAFQAAIDRTSIARAVLAGQAKAANSCVPNSITPPGVTSLSNTTANPALAKRLLAKAGYPHGLTITIATNYGVTIANLPATAQFLQTELAKAGITLKVHSYPTQAAYLNATAKGGFEALMDTFQPFVADAGFYMETTLATGSPVNYGAYSNKQVDKLVATASAKPVGAARNALLAQACKHVIQDVGLIPLVNIPTLTATSTGVSGVYDYQDLQLHFDEMSAS
jgi:peptide/nickel transport system substrate-binding protein